MMQIPIMFAHGQQGVLGMVVIMFVAGIAGLLSLGAALGSLARKTDAGRGRARKLCFVMLGCFVLVILTPVFFELLLRK